MIRLCIIRGLKILAFGILAGLALGTAVMFLWNWLIPTIFTNGPEINFVQALGIFALSKILFSGFKRGGYCGGHCGQRGQHWRNKLEEKMSAMTPEEKEKFKQKFGNRCKSWMGDEKEC
jgi:hypothetical protein